MSNRCHFSLMMMTAKTDLTKIQANDAKKIANVFIFQCFSTVHPIGKSFLPIVFGSIITTI